MWKASSMVFILKLRNPLEGDDECIPSNSIVGTRCLFGGPYPLEGYLDCPQGGETPAEVHAFGQGHEERQSVSSVMQQIRRGET